VPHFEKMLYDNAMLIMAYSAAYSVSKEEIFLDTAVKTADYVLREMVSGGGGFYSAQDADSEGTEGKFYIWSLDEITEVLGKEKGEEFASVFDITAGGNFDGMNIPNLLKSGIINHNFNEEINKLYNTDSKIRLEITAVPLSFFIKPNIAAASMYGFCGTYGIGLPVKRRSCNT